MSVPDKHDGEPTAEVQGELYTKWVAARTNAASWKAEEERLRLLLQGQLDGADAGTIFGRKVIAYRPKEQWAVQSLVKDYPELTQHYWKPTTKLEFDLAKFRLVHPEIVGKYQVRSFVLLGAAEAADE